MSLLKKSMYLLLLLSIFSFTSCFPSFHQGKLPDEVEFNYSEFEEIRRTISQYPEVIFFSTETPPSLIPQSTIDKMESTGLLDYNKYNEAQVFFCGYGILDQPAWGFLHGNLADRTSDTPITFTKDSIFLEIKSIEPIESKWFRFSGNRGKKFN